MRISRASNSNGEKQPRPGRVTEFDVVALLPPDPAARGHRRDVGRMVADIWIGMVWSLLAFALRLICWLLATKGLHEVFDLGERKIARTFGVTARRASRALDALVASPYLEEAEPPCRDRRRPGRYRLGSIFGEATTPTTPPTTTNTPPWQ